MSLTNLPSSGPATAMPASNRSQLQSDRMVIDHLALAAPLPAAAGQDVIAGLSQRQKSLPPKYFYDDWGSQLFEQITTLPEYYLTRTETQILQQVAPAIARTTGACELIELGSGSSTKTRYLLDAYQDQAETLRYLPVDVSGTILKDSAQQLLADYPTLSLHGLVGTYDQALDQLPSPILSHRLIAFIGSSLGNLSDGECDRFLSHISRAMAGGDYFLLGIDLQKDVAILEQAYNDRQGVTAAFNLNMLSHLNWRFQGDFQLEQFRHLAFYNPQLHQIELYLESLVPQTVTLKALDLRVQFQAGERLLSEISRKFALDQIVAQLDQCHLPVQQIFTDDRQWFGLILCQKQDRTQPIAT